MEPIDVTATFSPDGAILPLSFTWEGRRYLVESNGKSWESPRGWHIPVLTPAGRLFELVFVSTERRWFLKTVNSQSPMA